MAGTATIAWIGPVTSVANGYYRTLTLDQPASDLTDFPVLFTGTYTYLKTVANGGKVENANGYDIRFFSDSALTTLLAFERVFWDATTGVVEFWVKIPTLTSASAKIIYLAYGNSGISSDQQNASGVWSNGFNAVYHLPNGTTLTANDSTSNGNNGTLTNTPTAIAGQIDGAANFVAASNQYVDIQNPASLQITGDITVEAWVNLTTRDSMNTVIAKFTGFPGSYLFDFVFGQVRFLINSAGVGDLILGSTVVNASQWYYVVAVHTTSGTMDIYLNGTSDAAQVTGGSASISNTSDHVFIAFRAASLFNGSIDEVRISSTNRTATWIATCYSNQNDPANFYIIGSETPA